MSDDRRDASIESDDRAARESALDVRRSFLVQAPAGSGKTELLIQRFLALLPRVEHPERIVAVTFTRKGAGEMRERIIAALRDAMEQKPVATSHGQRTRRLADAVLAHDRQHRWHLVAHPARLAVTTIDALAAGFARQAPLAAGMGALPRYEEHATPLYAEAARRAVAAASGADRGWRKLLAHVDNDADRAVQLVADMLARRDQWIAELRPSNRAEFRAMIETTLAAEVTGQLATIAALLPVALLQELVAYERYAAANLRTDPETAAIAAQLAAAADDGGLPAPEPSRRETWAALANWLLVARDARFRAAVNVAMGFPPKASGIGAADRRQVNDGMTQLLRGLAAVPELDDALHVARRLPSPVYDEEAWALLDALLDVLPDAVAYLTLVFRDAGAIDFTQGALAALQALGDDSAPSDLLLRLDLRIEHLLIDEFQDTSFTQLALVRRLTAGWQPDDGRTLFAVGDPMQSIYRFRGAEVRLFVDASNEGRVADVPVENVVLRRNFRAQAGLVEWINGVYPSVLGSLSDPWRGVVGFVPATAALPAVPEAGATVEVFVDAQAEAEGIVERIRTALATTEGDVAVLVRARAHLTVVLPALRAARIAFAAVELDALAQRQAVLDLVSLTHALIQPADRLAWLAVLRAPWCGLTLSDLLAVAAEAERSAGGSLAALVETRATIAALSPDGAARWTCLTDALVPALAARGRAGVAVGVRGAWLALGGPATLDEAMDLDAAEQYFALLAEREVAGDVPDWPSLLDALSTLYAAPGYRDPARVQLMTLHRAKGLEFDTVIIAGLDRVAPGGEGAILHWRRRPRGLLLAPMTAHGSGEGSVYAYLDMLARGEEAAELGRILYVGCTRARHRLHLTGVLGTRVGDDAALEWRKPASGSALARLWPAVSDRVAAPVATASLGTTSSFGATPSPPRPLVRLPQGWASQRSESGLAVASVLAGSRHELPFEWARSAARHVGTVAHRLFAQIGAEGLGTWNGERIAGLASRIGVELGALGVADAELATAVKTVAEAVAEILKDERGRWLFDPSHSEAQSEWALAGVAGASIEHVVVDRTFVAAGVRWIVDVKTGTHEGADRDAFLDRELERYREQLERYARLVRAIDSRPIRLVLYYPLLGGWREWAADP